MRASELIALLQAKIAEHGDCLCYAMGDFFGDSISHEATTVRVLDGTQNFLDENGFKVRDGFLIE